MEIENQFLEKLTGNSICQNVHDKVTPLSNIVLRSRLADLIQKENRYKQYRTFISKVNFQIRFYRN